MGIYTVLGYSHVVCFSRFSMSSGYLYCIRVLTRGMFKQVFYEVQYLYCIRVLTRGMFKQVFYEERVFILY